MGDVVATIADAVIAVPLAMVTYCVGIPVLAIGVGIVRGFHELSEYVNGNRGLLRMAAPMNTQKRLEAAHEPVAQWRDVAQPGARLD